MKRHLQIVLCALVLMVGVVPLAAQDNIGTVFEKSTCLFLVPADQTVECGYVTVLENHSDPAGDTIRLAVAVFKAKSANPAPDPIIYLEGGPGGNSLSNSGTGFNQLFEPFIQDRDVILFDQRGTGYSEPALNCTNFTDLIKDTLRENYPPSDEEFLLTKALQECATDLQDESIDLAAYNSAQNAADVDAIRQALGYEQVNLYGTSYGTRLALTVMRDFPAGVRSSIMGAVYPPQVNLFIDALAGTDRVLDVLFAGCAADPACAEAYPDLETVFYELVDQWNEEPVKMSVLDAFGGEMIEASINGDELISGLFTALYATDLIPTLPETIYAARDGNYETLAGYFALIIATNSFVSRGMYFSVECHDEAPFTTTADFEAALAQYPELAQYMSRSGDPAEVCSVWPSGAGAPIENEPVVSDIPSLLLAGEYDPITPPEWARLAGETLSTSYVYKFPGMGHDAAFQPCPVAITLEFLANPAVEPDSSCISELKPPAFILPNQQIETAAVTLIPFETADFTALVPEGWSEVLAGTFARGQTPLDQTALVLMTLPVPAQAYLQGVALQVGGGEMPESAGTVEANGLTWTLYEIELLGYPSNVALAESGGKTFLIQMVSNSGEQDAVVEQVFIPVINAFVPKG